MKISVETVNTADALTDVEAHWLDEVRQLYVVRKVSGQVLNYNWRNVVCVWEHA